jgi:hypothetical protein
VPGAQLVKVRYLAGAPFVIDPSQLMRPPHCVGGGETTLAMTMRQIRRGTFDYVWFIGLSPGRGPEVGWLTPVWRGESGILYRFTSPPPEGEPGARRALQGAQPG